MNNVGIVTDWFVTYAGAERVVKEFIDLYPTAELYSVIDFLNDEARKQLNNKQAKTTFIQNLPFPELTIKNICHSCH